MHALGRIGEAGDVAAAIEFLLNPANQWITGQVLGVDGGLGTGLGGIPAPATPAPMGNDLLSQPPSFGTTTPAAPAP